MQNKLYIGGEIELPKGRFLYIVDDVPLKRPKSKVFDPDTDYFNPLHDVDHKKAREISAALYTASPGGENTLTVRNGRRALSHALPDATRLDELAVKSRIKGVKEEVEEMMDDVFFSPVLKRVLCTEMGENEIRDFAFNGKVFARINRVELGEQDALILGRLLMGRYPGPVIVDDLGFYGCDLHTYLIREGRLIARVNHLDELPSKLRAAVLRMDVVAEGAKPEDAEELASYRGLIRGTNEYNDFVGSAVRRG